MRASEHALAELNLCRLYAPVFAWSTASMRVLENAGSARERILSRSAVKDGKIVDQVVYALTRDPAHHETRARSEDLD